VRRRLAALFAVGAAILAAATAATGSPPPQVAGRAYLVANATTRELLAHYHEFQELPMASVTKVMTALVVLEHTRPDEVVTVGGPAPTIGGSTVGLRAGERLTVRQLLTAALVQSANDAAYALAYYVGHGSVTRFVALMNAKAKVLGLHHTHFVRPDGLDAVGHYSSAHDLLELAQVAMQNPLFRTLVRIKTTTIPGGRALRNWNDLLFTYPGTIGVKTGHTSAAGWNEIAAARRKGVTMYAIILGSPTRSVRNTDLARLLTWGFDQYRVVQTVTAGHAYARALEPFSSDKLTLVAARSTFTRVRVDRPLVQRVVAPAMVSLPVSRGETLGQVRVYSKGKLVARSPLVAAVAVKSPSFGQRVGWYAGQALHHAGNLLRSFAGLFT